MGYNPKAMLRDIAINYLWANPHEDKQVLIRMNQISPSRGVVGFLPIPYGSIVMPDGTNRWVVFELGRQSLVDMGIGNTEIDISAWVSLKDLMEANNFLAFVSCDGVVGKAENLKIKKELNGNLLLASEFFSNKELRDRNNPKYILFYSFARYED